MYFCSQTTTKTKHLASKKLNYTVYFAMPQSEYWLDPSVILSSVIPAHFSGSLPIYI